MGKRNEFKKNNTIINIFLNLLFGFSIRREKIKMSITHNKIIESPELHATIVEPILLLCINKSSMFEISWKMRTMLSLHSYIIKNHLFYLIEYEVISYDCHKRTFAITDGGYELLETIEKETRQENNDIKNIFIVFEGKR
jgi:hypothetical protein